MSAVVLNPGVKPGQWAIQPALVAPEWEWVWDGSFKVLAPLLFDDSIIRDYSGSNNNFTLFNTPTWNFSSLGKALSFNGSNQYAQASGVGYQTDSDDFSIFVSVVLNDTPASFESIVSDYDANNGDEGWAIRFTGANLGISIGGTLGFETISINSATYGAGSRVVVSGSWDEANKTFTYIASSDGNNTSVRTVTSTKELKPSSHPLKICAGNLNTGNPIHYINAKLEAVYLRDRQSTPSQLRQLYNDPFGPFRMDLGRIATISVKAPAAATAVAPDNIDHVQSVAQCSYLQTHLLPTDNVSQDVISAETSVSQTHDTAVSGAVHGIDSDIATIAQAHLFSGADANHAVADDGTAIVQTHSVAADGASHTTTANAVSFVADGTLDAANNAHGTVVDTASFSQVHDLAVSNDTHDNITVAAAIAQTHALASVGADHSNITAASAFSQTHAIGAIDCAHAQIADTASITAAGALSGDTTTHENVTEPATLAQGHVLADANTDHATSSSAATLAQTHVIATDAAVHSQDAPTATFGVYAQTVDATHETVSNVASFVQAHTVPIADAVHAVTSDEDTLAQIHALVIANATHGLSSDDVSMSSVSLVASDKFTVEIAVPNRTAAINIKADATSSNAGGSSTSLRGSPNATSVNIFD